jgi:3'(2'), 5'-bisphosphate nucleotidase
VLEAAGGRVLALSGESLAYGKAAENFLNPYFIAAANAALAERGAAEMRRLLG